MRGIDSVPCVLACTGSWLYVVPSSLRVMSLFYDVFFWILNSELFVRSAIKCFRNVLKSLFYNANVFPHSVNGIRITFWRMTVFRLPANDLFIVTVR